jgi:hypothetical protein
MMLMGFSGFGGLGNVDWSTMCVRTQVDETDPNFLDCIGTNGDIIDSRDISSSSSSSSSSPSSADSNPWWSTALTALVKGTTQGLTTSSTPTAPIMPIVAATPWYSTPTGMIGIAAAVLGVGYVLMKK